MCFKNIVLTFPLHFENIISEHFKRFTNNVKISNDAKLIKCFFNVPARTLLITSRELFDNIMIMFPVRWIAVYYLKVLLSLHFSCFKCESFLNRHSLYVLFVNLYQIHSQIK